jgi:two-component system torCAD operon response regulator TorR
VDEHTHHLLIVEDEPVTRTRLVEYFRGEGYRVTAAENGAAMRQVVEAMPVDLVLLDINLPDEDGLVLAREQRSRSQAGIILVTGRADEVDRIVGLEVGADDYVTKPFNLRELLARVKNLLRRIDAARVPDENNAIKQFAGWRFDIPRRRLTSSAGEPVALTRGEYQLLVALVNHPGIVLSRDRLLENITHRSWSPSDRTVDVLIRRLRQKIETTPADPEIIVTVHGEGYVFTAEVS